MPILLIRKQRLNEAKSLAQDHLLYRGLGRLSPPPLDWFTLVLHELLSAIGLG